jgi:hypothetical protein
MFLIVLPHAPDEPAARYDGDNRVIKTDARCAYGDRDPVNQRIRTRLATTRRGRECPMVSLSPFARRLVAVGSGVADSVAVSEI